MKVLLKEDVDNLGYAGEVYKVADGYGRNYLIPKGLAVLASPGVMKQADVWRKKAEARREELRAEYKMLSEKIEQATLNYVARAGETGKLYGSITTSQITDDLNELLGTDIDRRKVGVEPLRQLGKHDVIVRLSADFQPYITVIIEPEEGSPAAMITEAEAVEVVVEEMETEAEIEEDLDLIDETEDILDSLEEDLAEDLTIEDELDELE
ncbi:MAG: 50S ribosomal protein L9 [Candidatus Promineifilaceae bacterium]|jgi:large subunit ribosomal protein L9